MSLFKRKSRAKRTGYMSPLDPLIKAHDDGELSDEEFGNALLRLGDLRPGMYYSNGRCKHLGPYPGCSGGCNRH